MTPDTFIDALMGLRSPDAFNPYTDTCDDHDVVGAPEVRRRNLRLVLEAALATGIESIWVARDLGYRGGRRTGLALTDESHLKAHAKLYGGLPLARATRGPIVAEMTAKTVWTTLSVVGRPVFLWNVYPLHPHPRGDPMSNRPHSRAERESASHLVLWLVAVLRPRIVVAVGKDAFEALRASGVEPLAVRHPSHGGQSEFRRGIANAYGLTLPPTASGWPRLL